MLIFRNCKSIFHAIIRIERGFYSKNKGGSLLPPLSELNLTTFIRSPVFTGLFELHEMYGIVGVL